MTRSQILAKRLLEAEPQAPPPPEQEPTESTPPILQNSADVKGEIEKLAPTREYRFKGSSMWNAAGMLNLAVRGIVVVGNRKDTKWGMDVLKAMNAPADVIQALISGRADVRADGNDAVVTVRAFGPETKKRPLRIRRQPPE